MISVTRVYTDDDGDSQFEDVDIVLHPGGEIGLLSDPLAAKDLIFREVEQVTTGTFTMHQRASLSSCSTVKLKSKLPWA